MPNFLISTSSLLRELTKFEVANLEPQQMLSFLKFNQNFISEVQSTTKTNVRNKIELLALEFLKDPKLEFISRKKTNSAMLEDGIIRLGSKISQRTSKGTKHFRKLSQMWIVLDQIHTIVLHNIPITQRDLFYKVSHFGFNNQEEVNDLVLDVTSTIDVPRHQLGIYATSKGMVGGRLEWCHADYTHGWHNIKSIFLGTKISGNVDWREFDIRSDAVVIIVVEKEGIYHRLMEDQFYDRIPSIIITGCGFPDLSTRMLLHRLHSVLDIPVVCLVDYNPHGYQIYFTYAYGSYRMGMETSLWAIPNIYWLGLHSSDFMDLQLQNEPFTLNDDKKINCIMCDEGLKEEHFKELHYMAKNKQKVELEVMYNILGIENFSQFIERKLIKLASEYEEFEVIHNFLSSKYNKKK